MHRREADGSWPDEPTAQTAGLTATLRIACLELDLPLSEIYRGTYLSEPASKPPAT